MTPKILIAGVGNVFRGDDAFGVEVVRLLAARPLPPEVRVIDFGIRGQDLAFALADGYDVAILVDAAARRGCPGALYDIEPELDPGRVGLGLDSHGIHLPAVFEFARLLGGALPRLRLVACEPATLGPADEGFMGLSDPVAAAVEPAADLVETIIAEVIAGDHRA